MKCIMLKGIAIVKIEFHFISIGPSMSMYFPGEQ